MKLTSVLFNGFKNKEGVQELTGFDLFTGNNGVGKSSVLQAVELAITGNVNGMAQAKNIFKYSNNRDGMTVGIATNSEFSLNRTYLRKAKPDKESGDLIVKYSEKLKVPTSESTSNKAQQEEIQSILGDFPVGFDFKKFLGMTDTEKRNFILSFCKDSTFTQEDVEKYLSDKIVDGLNEEIYYNTIGYLMDETDSDDVQKQVKDMLTVAKEQLSFYKKEIERQKVAIQKLSEKKSSFLITDKGLAIDKKKYDKLNEQLICLEKEISVVDSDNKRAKVVLAKMAKLQSEVKILEDSKPAKSLESVQQELNIVKTSLGKLNDDSASISKSLEMVSNQYKNAAENVKKQRAEYESVQTKGIELKTKYNTQFDLVNQVKNTKGKCAINALIPCNADFSNWLNSKTSELRAMKIELDLLRKDYVEKQDKLKKFESEWEELGKKRESLISSQQEVIRNTQTSNSKFMSLEKLQEEIKSFDTVKADKIKSRMTELESLQSEKKEVVDLTEKLNQIAALRGQITELKNEIYQKEQLKALTSQIKEANEDFKTTELTLDVYKHLVLIIGQKGLQGELFKSLVSPMLDEINKNLKLMGINRKFFISTVSDQENEVFHFGLIDEVSSETIDFDTLSTGQQAMLSVAMIVAFIAKANVPVKILCLDNLEALDVVNRNNVINGLSEMYKLNMLDNILVAGCMESVPAGDFKVWHM